MADTKISALTALAGSSVDTAADVIPIVDTSTTTTKKILVDELRIAIGIATQAQMEAASSNVVFVTPGGIQYGPSVAKAWVQLTGGGTPVASSSHNYTSVADNGVGDWTITWAITMSSANYFAIATVNGTGSFVVANVWTKTATTTRIRMFNNNNNVADPDVGLDVAIFGDI